jgi:hypothetical protein
MFLVRISLYDIPEIFRSGSVCEGGLAVRRTVDADGSGESYRA